MPALHSAGRPTTFAGMSPDLSPHRAAIAEICRRFHVRRLELFGSAARGADFDPGRSDIDLLVTWEPGHDAPEFAAVMALQDALEGLLGRRVDLAMASAVRNPYLRARIEASRLPLHGA